MYTYLPIHVNVSATSVVTEEIHLLLDKSERYSEICVTIDSQDYRGFNDSGSFLNFPKRNSRNYVVLLYLAVLCCWSLSSLVSAGAHDGVC